MGIEPTPSAWKAEVLPLNYTRPISKSFLTESFKSSRAQIVFYFCVTPLLANPVIVQATPPTRKWWRGEDSNLRRLSQQIYSLPPLTAREPLRKTATSSKINSQKQLIGRFALRPHF
jgi:hypothetical protein